MLKSLLLTYFKLTVLSSKEMEIKEAQKKSFSIKKKKSFPMRKDQKGKTKKRLLLLSLKRRWIASNTVGI